ncbi:MAG: 50S ribosomal protein L6 [Eubacteriales bacterium]|nr:50S ribosomal protein L6 [Eubacteriales bacterium]
MSRIGKLPITIPAGVTVTVDENNTVKVKGPKGELSQVVNRAITLEQNDGVLTLNRPSDSKPHKAMHGLYRALVNNMVVGVSTGFSKTLLLIGTGYRAEVKGDTVVLNIGYSHPVEIKAPANVTFTTPEPTKLVISGIDKQVVGNLAADIRELRKPEPYLGKGIKYDDEVIRRKVGKTGK